MVGVAELESATPCVSCKKCFLGQHQRLWNRLILAQLQRLWNEDFEKTDFKKIHRHFENIICSAERYLATKNACLRRVISSL